MKSYKLFVMSAAAALLMAGAAQASGIGNSYGGDAVAGATGGNAAATGGTAVSGAQAGALALGVQGQGQMQAASSDQSQGQSQSSTQANQQAVTTGSQSAASSNEGNTLAVANTYRAAASSAFAAGQIGQKVCGVVIGGGYQTMGQGFSAGLPLPAPRCNAREDLMATIQAAGLSSNPQFWADVALESFVTGDKAAKVYKRRATAAATK